MYIYFGQGMAGEYRIFDTNDGTVDTLSIAEMKKSLKHNIKIVGLNSNLQPCSADFRRPIMVSSPSHKFFILLRGKILYIWFFNYMYAVEDIKEVVEIEEPTKGAWFIHVIDNNGDEEVLTVGGGIACINEDTFDGKKVNFNDFLRIIGGK